MPAKDVKFSTDARDRLLRGVDTLQRDEPFGALDEVTRGEMRHLLLAVVRTYRTAAVLITHDIDEAPVLSDRVLLLGGAPASEIGAWQIDLPKPREDYVAELGQIRIEILSTLRDAAKRH